MPVWRWHKAQGRARLQAITRCPPSGSRATPTRTPLAPANAALERGANSFTEGQARRRIEDRGYTNVDQLHKDQNSIWQAEAMKDGRRVRVGVDFRGNVVEENR